MNNAFNSIPQQQVMKANETHLPEAINYTKVLLYSPIPVFYQDRKNKLCMQVNMENGVCQGNPMSSINFNLAQIEPSQRIRQLHPNLFLISYHYILGNCNDALSAYKTFDMEMQTIGLSRNLSKSIMYDPNDQDDIIKDL
jgi:hypothetical protein